MLRKIACGLVLLVGCILMMRSGMAASELDTPSLFIEPQVPLPESTAQGPAVIRSRHASLNWEAIHRLPETHEMLVNFFPDSAFTFVIERDASAGEAITYVGSMRELALSTVILTIFEGRLYLDLYAPGAIYIVRAVDAELYLITQIDQSAYPADAPAVLPEVPQGEPGLLPETVDDSPYIDVLVVYTPAARIAAGGTTAIQGEISQDIAATNTAYANSRVTQRLRLVGTVEVSYVESGDMQTDLRRLQDKNDGYLVSVHALRNAVYADLVSLYVTSPSDNYGGIAYVMAEPGTYFEAWAFSVIFEGSSGSLTFAHELGHNMGGQHDWYVASTVDPYAYAHGYVDPVGRFRTIMSYHNLCGELGIYCERLPYFSNPEVLYDGRPMGVPPGTDATCPAGDEDHYACDAHVALTFSRTLPLVANFRDNPADAPVFVKHCGTLDSETWSASQGVHLVECDVVLPEADTLTIEAGTIVKFNPSSRLLVNGNLQAVGSASHPIVFTSYKDDSAGGDTDGGGESIGTPGDWGWIEFSPGSKDASRLEYTHIRFGGSIAWQEFYGNIYLKDASPSILNSTISYSGGAGAYLQSSVQGAAQPSLTGNVFTGNQAGCLNIDVSSLLKLSGNTCSGNGTNGVEVRSGTISGAALWDQPNLSYRLTGEVVVAQGGWLTIGAGLIFKVDSHQRLIVEGGLTVNGTQAQPVVFTSYRDDTIGGNTDGGAFTTASPNDWGWIEFSPLSNDASRLSYAIIRYGGTTSGVSYFGNVLLVDASPTIEYSTFTQGGRAGLYLQTYDSGGAHPVLSGNTFTDNRGACLSAEITSLPVMSGNTCTANGTNGVEVRSSTLLGAVTWDQADLPYRLSGDLIVFYDGELTIEPGVIIKLDDSVRLLVLGGLTVSGTAQQPVCFTSYRDDSIGGDTNGDGPSIAAPGDWGRIEFDVNSTGASLLEHAVISYGGGEIQTLSFGSLFFYNISPTVRYSRIAYAGSYGIYSRSTSPSFTCNDIYGNALGGIYNASLVTLTAIDHWWGSASGPYHPEDNPEGTGDAVSDGVVFIPWAESPCQALLPPPSNLRAVTLDASRIQLNWQDYSDESAFSLERSPDGKQGWEEVALLDANLTSYTDGGLPRLTTYYYRLRAYRESDDQFSEYSNTAFATTNSTIWLWLPMLFR